MESSRQPHLAVLRPPEPASMKDEDLVREIAKGDKDALRVVWDRYATAVRATLRSTLGGDHTIDDLVQEVFFSFYRSAGRLRDPSALRPYLLGVAVKQAAFELRTRTRRGRWHRLFHWTQSSSGEALKSMPDVDERDALQVLNRLLGTLPERERNAFILRYVQDLSPTEVSQALGLSHSTAKRAIAEGKKRVLARARKEPALASYLRTSVQGGP